MSERPRDPTTGRFVPDTHLLAVLSRQKPHHAALAALLTPRQAPSGTDGAKGNNTHRTTSAGI